LFCPRKFVGISLATNALLALLSLAPASAVALPEDSQQPIQIDADAAELDENKNLATYHGNVQMRQGTMQVSADKMTIELRDKTVVRITAEGNNAHYQQQLKADESMVSANARTITYYTQDERVSLVGDATLTQNNNQFSGATINYDIREGKVDAQAAGEGKVQMILQPAVLDEPQ
jgi:lipopolysaccharide export system protein LptA